MALKSRCSSKPKIQCALHVNLSAEPPHVCIYFQISILLWYFILSSYHISYYDRPEASTSPLDHHFLLRPQNFLLSVCGDTFNCRSPMLITLCGSPSMIGLLKLASQIRSDFFCVSGLWIGAAWRGSHRCKRCGVVVGGDSFDQTVTLGCWSLLIAGPLVLALICELVWEFVTAMLKVGFVFWLYLID